MELEKRYILKTLKRLRGNREKTAAALSVDKSTLWRKLKCYDERAAAGHGGGVSDCGQFQDAVVANIVRNAYIASVACQSEYPHGHPQYP